MDSILNCPACDGSKISKAFVGFTNRNPNDGKKWDIFKCASCGHGFLNPQPSATDLEPYYSANYDPYEADHSAINDDDAVVQKARLERQFRHVEITPGQKVLDVGCGGGYFLRICKKLGASTFGVEPSVHGAKMTQSQGVDVYHGYITDFVKSVKVLPSFDLITSSHVVEHMPDPVACLRDMKKLLNPRGYIWTSVPNAACYFSEALGAKWHSVDLPFHLHQFSPESMQVIGHRAGLKIRRQYTFSYPPATAASLRHLLRQRFFIPQRLSMESTLFNQYLAEKVGNSLDTKGKGEAIITEYEIA